MSADSKRAPLLIGLPPVVATDARVLVLGSMPGGKSLELGQYYAHPRNAFWPIMGRLLDAGPDRDYDARLTRLTRAGVALWDVIGRCRRRGSLDQRIDTASIEVNDFAALFQGCPDIGQVLFNGQMARHSFERWVAPELDARAVKLKRQTLPSTSPAHATLDLEAKCEQWRVALAPVLIQR